MADSSEKSPVVPPEVRELIEESQKIQGWVERLAEHADEARPEVYRRVLSDYQGRLQKVTGRLVKHRADLVSKLEGHQGEVESLARGRDTHAAELEEARLRHAVGEYSDDDWSERREGIDESISEIDARLSVEKKAVEELSAIISSIGEGGTPAIEEPAAANGGSDVSEATPAKPDSPSGMEPEAGTPDAEAPAAKTGKAAAPEPEPAEPAQARAAAGSAAKSPETPRAEAEAEKAKVDPGKAPTKEPAAGKDAPVEGGKAAGKDAPVEGGKKEPDGDETPGGDYLDELEFLESLSLDEAERFDAVSAMLDDDEAGNGKKES